MLLWDIGHQKTGVCVGVCLEGGGGAVWNGIKHGCGVVKWVNTFQSEPKVYLDSDDANPHATSDKSGQQQLCVGISQPLAFVWVA